MISEQDAIKAVQRRGDLRAYRVADVSLETLEGERTYCVRLSEENGEPAIEVHVALESGKISQVTHHRIYPADRAWYLHRAAQRSLETEARIRELLRDGARLSALREWRKHFGGSLHEAKAAINAYSKHL